MSDSGRFCVQFSGTDVHSVTKTRILYKDSNADDVRSIWKLVYNSDPPDDIHLNLPNQSTYSLNDENDFSVVMTIAEDQYRVHPSNPLHITLSRYYKPNTPPSSNPSPKQLPNDFTDSPKNAQGEKNGNQKSPLGSDQSNAASIPEVDYYREPEPEKGTAKLIQSADDSAVVYDLSVKKKKWEKSPPGSCNGDPQKQAPYAHFNSQDTRRKPFNIPSNEHSTTIASAHPLAQVQMTKVFPSRSSKGEGGRTSLNAPSTSAPPLPITGSPVPFINSVQQQQQRLLQNNPNSPFFWQSIRNSYERFAAMSWLKQLAKPTLENQSAYPDNAIDFKYLSERDANFAEAATSSSRGMKKAKRKLDANGEIMKKDRSSVKRMRSSSSQSNIEFHCEQAEMYMNLPAPLKKEHNSAHRSHWKHLSHVLSIWPQFASLYKHKKYDEWSSEARDIYAISLPEEYKWSFLTLAKQGDQLCRRIKRRVEEMRRTPQDQRPEWCPPDETLNITWAKADERLQQLERIRDSRHVDALSTSPCTSQASTGSLFSSPVPPSLLSPDSSLRRNMFSDCGANLLGQQSKMNRCLVPFSARQSNPSAGQLPARNDGFVLYPGDASSATSEFTFLPPTESPEATPAPPDANELLLQQMKIFAANFKDHRSSTATTSALKTETNDTPGYSKSPVETKPTAVPLSPRSPRRIA